ncbi:kinesin-like protein KIN-7E, chloroplastic isoform X1 [Nymphaea colorata]|nr:kinesin-like protein KIN-7E, chloroplastic isoform X1 [Nymphaea colorata]XP_031473877.1 kinesin-like protein KIN-7E, chloroplastic isoform X1 [Nymphaea colorata]
MSSSSSRTQRSSSSVSPFRTRKAAAVPKSSGRPPTPSATSASLAQTSPLSPETADSQKAKENVTVTVRFRPLSSREINKGDEIAWYADGDYTVRNESNASIGYSFDRVFGPATTTRHVYDVAAQHVINGAMEGINGTIFAYGVTSSGKTHTMHGEQKSPGIIPLAIKDVFSIIQETPSREFLLRVSYLEIYNEVINDLLDPTAQNLKIREDSQGTYVEGIKEEVVLSPAHALSLIASGEEHRHVGSNNFNLLSSRSHTIFSLSIESSPRGENLGEEDVTLSQLNLIDLAGSESSKTETTGLRRKEGSYINKSLLTLGTVIAKLTDGKATHIPYRDSKLTRLLQSSLSGHGRISLICTVTPASSNSEETHNTLKFAHRSKHVEIKASQNKIMDEKSLIKKYQREISSLKQELQQLKRGMMERPYLSSNQEDLVNLKLQLEAGQVKLQSRLEEEEQAKAALMGRIQRLTKLILVSTKNAMPSNLSVKASHRRRHSFGEDELVYLPDRKRDYLFDDDVGSLDSELSAGARCDGISLEELKKDYKKGKRRGMLSWLKLRRPENFGGIASNTDCESSASGSPASSRSSQQKDLVLDMKDGQRKSVSRAVDDASSITNSFQERTQAGDLFCAAPRGRGLPPTGTTITDQMDLLREQVKMLAGEVALCTSSLKRLAEQAAERPDDSKLQGQIRKLKDEINEKRLQMHILEQRMLGTVEVTPRSIGTFDISQALSKLATQLNEKTFELEIKSADNRILQEQLQLKLSENAEMQETILLLRQQMSSLMDKGSAQEKYIVHGSKEAAKWTDLDLSFDESCTDANTPTSVINLSAMSSQNTCTSCENSQLLQEKNFLLVEEIEKLKQEKDTLLEEKGGLEIQCQKLGEEASYAKELASAAAVELRNLAEEVTRLTYHNARLNTDLTAAKEETFCRNSCCQQDILSYGHCELDNGIESDECPKGLNDVLIEELKNELAVRCQREASLESALSQKGQREAELQKKIEEAKHREKDLEHELANMWVLFAKMKQAGLVSEELTFDGMNTGIILQQSVKDYVIPSNGIKSNQDGKINVVGEQKLLKELYECYETEKKKCKELESFVSRLKLSCQGDDLVGLDVTTLEELQSVHIEAITKICHAKCATNVS